MPTIQSSRHCSYCERKTLHEKERFSSGAGCVLSILTLGIFVPIWLLLGAIEAFRPWRCQRCGGGKWV